MSLVEKRDNRVSLGHQLCFAGDRRRLGGFSTELCAGRASRRGGRVGQEVCGLSPDWGGNYKVKVQIKSGCTRSKFNSTVNYKVREFEGYSEPNYFSLP